MNIQLADSLEEFDINYIESCNQCSTIDRLPSGPDTIASKTNQLTLSSPLLDNDDDNDKFKPNFDKQKFLKPKSTFHNPKMPLAPAPAQAPPHFFKRPPLKPAKTDGQIPKQNHSACVGNPYYKSKPLLEVNSPNKKRKVSLTYSSSSYESLLSLNHDYEDIVN